MSYTGHSSCFVDCFVEVSGFCYALCTKVSLSLFLDVYCVVDIEDWDAVGINS